MTDRNSINSGITGEVLRPGIIPFRNGRKFFNFTISAEMVFVALGLFLHRQEIVIIALAFLLVFPGIPLLFGLLRHFLWFVTVFDKKMVIRNYLPCLYLPTGIQQSIDFEDIDYIYYAEREFNLLKNYRHKLKKFKIPAGEIDYTRGNLIQKYAVPEKIINAFEHSSHKALNDYTATGVLMVADKILDKYRVPKSEKKAIVKVLKETDDFDFEHIKKLFSAYSVELEDFDELKDACSDCDVGNVTLFLLTRLQVARAETLGRGRGGVGTEVAINSTLVLSNGGGTKKVYLKHFHSLSRANWQKLIRIINENKSGIRYLMPNQSYRNISDPNFKPGRG